MAKPYDSDLRKRIFIYIQQKKARKWIANTFSVSVSTIDRWIAKYKATGNILPKRDNKVGRKSKITDWQGFADFAEQNRCLSLEEMKEKYSIRLSYQTISRALKALGYSYKKNSGYTQKEMMKLEINTSKKSRENL